MFDFRNLKERLENCDSPERLVDEILTGVGLKQRKQASQSAEPFADYSESNVRIPGGEPFEDYEEEEIYGVDKDKKIDNYGGDEKVMQDVKQTQCPGCGAAMQYDPAVGALVCAFCGSKVQIVTERAVERKLKLGLDNGIKWSNETRAYRCSKCGAVSVFDKAEFSSKCPFCGSPTTVDLGDIEGVRPNAVIPFSVTEENARAAYRKWISSRAFAPRAFKKKKNLLQSTRAIYMPSWTFDSRTTSKYTATVGTYYYVTVHTKDGVIRERRVRYSSASGMLSKMFDDVLVFSGKEMTAAQFNKLCPYNTTQAVEYQNGYMAGFSAEHYSLSLSDGWERAQTKMQQVIRQAIEADLLKRYDVVQTINFNTNYAGNTFKYVLLPTYVCHTEYKKKNFKSFVNGVTGKVAGLYPKSPGKITGLVFGILLALAGITVGILFGLGIL